VAQCRHGRGSLCISIFGHSNLFEISYFVLEIYFPMHHKCPNVRMNSSPLDTAMEEFVDSPSRFVASSSYLGLAAHTWVSPCLVTRYKRPSEWSIEPHVPPPGRDSTFQTSSPVIKS